MTKSSKGSEFERTISKFLTQWLTGQNKELYFWRCAGSGSIFTRSRCNTSLSNDIKAIKPEGEFMTNLFSIECKKGYPKNSFDLHLKKNKNNGIRDFWDQTIDGCSEGKKLPMLIYGKKGFPSWIGITENTVDLLNLKESGLISISLTWGSEFKNLPTMVCFDLEDFFNYVKPDQIKALNH